MIFRQHRHKAILFQKNGIELSQGGQTHKAAVHPALCDPLFQFGITAQQQLVFDVRIVLLKLPDDVGQPVSGDAGKCTDADQPRLHPVQRIHLHLHLLIVCHQFLGIRQHMQPVGSQPHAAFSTFQKYHVPVLFQVADHPADPGLGIVQDLCCSGKAAVLHGLDKGQILLQIHIHVHSSCLLLL